MARRAYRQRRRRGARWAPSIQSFTDSQTAPGTTTPGTPVRFSNSITLAQNPTTNTINQTFTVKNVELTANFESTGNTNISLEEMCIFIMYVPQGMPIGINYYSEHPEYIMAYKYIGSPSDDSHQGYQPLRIKTRLSRKLQSGDSIVLFYTAVNSSTNTVQFSVDGIVRWWTKAN